MPADGADRPTTHVRATKLPLRRWTVIWTRTRDGKTYVDPIWHVDAPDEGAAMVLARETGRPTGELSVRLEES